MKKEIVTIKYGLLSKIVYSLIYLIMIGSGSWGILYSKGKIEDMGMFLIVSSLFIIFVTYLGDALYQVWFVGEHKAVIYKEENR